MGTTSRREGTSERDRAGVPRRVVGMGSSPALAPFVRQRTVLLMTYRRDGTPVGTPVSIVVDGDRAFVRTFDTAWKWKRIRKDPRVQVAPSTVRGKLTGPAIGAHARPLRGDEAEYARRALARKYPLLHDLVLILPGERHWHGAQPGQDFTHLSILLPGETVIDE